MQTISENKKRAQDCQCQNKGSQCLLLARYADTQRSTENCHLTANMFYEDNKIMIYKPGKNHIKQNYRPIFLTNIGIKMPHKIYKVEFINV